MTIGRVVRGAPARSRAAAEPEQAAPRRASRMPVNREVRGSRETTASFSQNKVTVREEAQSESLPARRFGPGEEPTIVRIGAGKTINMGNFNMVRIDVSVSIPCLPEGKEDAYDEAVDFLVEKMADQESFWTGNSTQRRANRRG